jgi:hypothetical protein
MDCNDVTGNMEREDFVADPPAHLCETKGATFLILPFQICAAWIKRIARKLYVLDVERALEVWDYETVYEVSKL